MISDWAPNPIWEEIYREKMEKYGTTDYDTINKMETYADERVEAEANTSFIANSIPI